MTRSSYQRGWIEQRRKGTRKYWVMRCNIRDARSKTGWKKQSKILRHCKSKKEAQQELDQWMKQLNVENCTTQSKKAEKHLTFAGFASGLWIEYMEQRLIKKATRYSYDSMLNNHLLPCFGDTSLREILPESITGFFHECRRKGLSPHTQLNLYAILRTMFEVAVDYGIAGNNPVRRKLHRARSTNTRKPVLAVDEVVKVISHAAEEFRSLLTTISVTGLRLGELLGLRWQDVDLPGGVIRIASSLWRGELQSPKTEESVRELHIPAGLVSVLSAHRQSSAFDGGENFVFCKVDGSPCDPDVLRKDVLYPAMDRAGIKRGRRTHGFHIFRHTAGTLAYQKTGDIKATQNLLGHTRISTTADIYAHHDNARTAAAMKAIEDGFSGFAHPPTVLPTPQTVVH